MLALPELKLLKCCDEVSFLKCYENHAARLTCSWLGRTIVVMKAELLSEASLLKLFEISLLKVEEARHIWALWRRLQSRGLYLKKEKASCYLWRHIKPLQQDTALGLKLWHKITSTSRILFRMMGFYFGLDPRFLFGAKSFWDLEQRFTSLKNLAAIGVTGALGIYQAVQLSSWVVSCTGLQLSWISQAFLVTTLAVTSIVAIGVLFYQLGRWFGGTPLEVWKCKNLTHEVFHEQEPLCLAREKEIAQLLGFFSSAKSQMVLIQGQAGTGKSVLVREFARKLAQDVLPPTLVRPQVFFLNAAQINSEGYSQPSEKLSVIREQIEGYESSVILAIDEAHMLDTACVELLKHWKDEGLRLILLTNSSQESLEEKWSKATYTSFLSHTKTTTIQLEADSRELLEAMIEQFLEKNPHIALTQEAKEALIEKLLKNPSAPRILNLVLAGISCEEKARLYHQEELLKLSQEIAVREEKISQAMEKGEWLKAERISHELEEALDQRKRRFEEARDRHEAITASSKRRRTFKEMRACIGSWVQAVEDSEEVAYFLGTIQRVFTEKGYLDLSFVPAKSKEEMAPFLQMFENEPLKT